MARKTTKICSLMLSRHDEHRNAILLDKSTTDREKILQLRAINSMMEDLLHKSNCYQGFKHLDRDGLEKLMEQYDDTPGGDYAAIVLDSVPENNRMYHGSRDW